LSAQYAPDGGGDIGGGKRCGRDLVQQRLEYVVVSTVDQHDVTRRAGQATGRLEAAEPASDDHDSGAPVPIIHALLSLPLPGGAVTAVQATVTEATDQ
jgi:hypothetical protein